MTKSLEIPDGGRRATKLHLDGKKASVIEGIRKKGEKPHVRVPTEQDNLVALYMSAEAGIKRRPLENRWRLENNGYLQRTLRKKSGGDRREGNEFKTR